MNDKTCYREPMIVLTSHAGNKSMLPAANIFGATDYPKDDKRHGQTHVQYINIEGEKAEVDVTENCETISRLIDAAFMRGQAWR